MGLLPFLALTGGGRCNPNCAVQLVYSRGQWRAFARRDDIRVLARMRARYDQGRAGYDDCGEKQHHQGGRAMNLWKSFHKQSRPLERAAPFPPAQYRPVVQIKPVDDNRGKDRAPQLEPVEWPSGQAVLIAYIKHLWIKRECPELEYDKLVVRFDTRDGMEVN